MAGLSARGLGKVSANSATALKAVVDDVFLAESDREAVLTVFRNTRPPLSTTDVLVKGKQIKTYLKCEGDPLLTG